MTPYETLVQSAARLSGTFDKVDEGAPLAATELLERNRAALESARSALNLRCAVPVRYEESFLVDHHDDVAHLRNLAHAFQAAALLAASRGEHGEAALRGIEMLELANATRRGGLVVDALVSIAIAGMAVETLRRIRADLDDVTRRTVADALRRIAQERESFDAIIARDREWELAVGYQEESCDLSLLDLDNLREFGLAEDELQELLGFVQQTADRPEADRRKMQLDQDRHIRSLLRKLRADLCPDAGDD